MAVWRRVAQKARKKEETARGEKSTEEEETEEMEGKQREGGRRRKWGCEAAVKRGRGESRGGGPSQLAGRVDADRESKGRVDGRG